VALTLAFAPGMWVVVLLCIWPEVAAQEAWVNVMPTFPGGTIIASCIALLASRLMNEGRELRDEHDLVI
jgi:biotin transporter BioY